MKHGRYQRRSCQLEVRAAIRFLDAEGQSVAEIHR
jgi:hypothetical protein